MSEAEEKELRTVATQLNFPKIVGSPILSLSSPQEIDDVATKNSMHDDDFYASDL